MQHIKYIDIARFQPKFSDLFQVGDNIVVEEKIDGANASIQYDPETNQLQAFSRRNTLTPFTDGLRGFYNFVQSLDVERIRTATNNGRFRIFGEWLVPHTVKYPQDRYGKFYMFDLMDLQTGEYLPIMDCMIACKEAGLDFVPILYMGPMLSWEHLTSLVGQTQMGGEYGEGIVVKNQDNNAYTKLVSERFAETKVVKHHDVDPSLLASIEEEKAAVKSVVTLARVQKLLLKMVDDGELPEDFDLTNMPAIAKVLPRRVYEDCVKEEPETVRSCGNFGKWAAKESMTLAKDVIRERETNAMSI